MKKRIRKAAALVLTVLLLTSAVPLFAGAVIRVDAGKFSYTIENDKATITDVDTEIEGNVIITATVGDSPVTVIGEYAFAYCDRIKSITIPDSVTVIEDNAFCYCSELESITIPDSVVSIGISAFAGCEKLKNITIPDSVTAIEDYTFYSCAALKSITIPQSVKSIGMYAFDSCVSLNSISIPASVENIGNGAFAGCSNVTKISVDKNNKNYSSDSNGVLFNKNKTELLQYACGNKSLTYSIPDSVKNIGESAFSKCGNLKSISIPDSVTSIGEIAFSQCGNLKSISIPDTVTDIAYATFAHCGQLENIAIPETVKSIDNSAFYGCKSIKSIEIPDSVTSIGEIAFSQCGNLKSISIPNTVTDIAYATFSHCGQLENIKIPETVKSIDNCAFYGCTSIKSIDIPDSVASIGKYAFNSCTSLENITIPSSVERIEEGLFSDCTELKNVLIPDSVTSIGSCAFSACTSLEDITIPSSVEIIEDALFCDCTELKNISIPQSVTSIGGYILSGTAYYNNDKNWENGALYVDDCLIAINYELLPSVYSIKDGTRLMASHAFSFCENLESITIPETVTSIPESAFSWCSVLSEVTIPDSVKSIEDFAFMGCIALTELKLPDTLEYIGRGILEDTPYYADLNWENNALYFDDYLIGVNNYNIDFRSFVIKDNTKVIANEMFSYNENLEKVTVPSSVTHIGKGVFYECQNLSDVYYKGTEEMWNKIKILPENYSLNDAEIHFIGCPLDKNYEHKYKSAVTEPTGTKNGFTKYTCDCGYSYITEFIDSDIARLEGDKLIILPEVNVKKLMSQAGKGSYVQTKEYSQLVGSNYPGTGMTFMLSDGSMYDIVVLGDVNGDADISAADARLALRASVGLEAFKEGTSYYKAANVEGEDKISASDARIILRASVGLENTEDWMK